MSIEKVRDFYGIKFVIPYDRTTKVPKCILRAVQEISYEVESEKKELTGGHVDAAFDVEYGQPSPSLTGTVREYPHQLFQLIETTTITEGAAEANGGVGTLANGKGSSVYNGSNGISGITVKTASKDNLAAGRYIFRATAAQTVEVLVAGLTDAHLDQEGLVVASVNCSVAGTVDIDALGVTITVSGTAAFTTDDTAYVDVRPANSGYTEILVGSGSSPEDFGVLCVFPRKTDGVIHYIDVTNVSGRGMPWRAASREFSEFELNWTPQVESDGSVYKIVRILGV